MGFISCYNAVRIFPPIITPHFPTIPPSSRHSFGHGRHGDGVIKQTAREEKRKRTVLQEGNAMFIIASAIVIAAGKTPRRLKRAASLSAPEALSRAALKILLTISLERINPH